MSKKSKAFGHLLISQVKIADVEFRVQHYMFGPIDMVKLPEVELIRLLSSEKLHDRFVQGALEELTDNERELVKSKHLETQESVTVLLIGIHRLKRVKGEWQLADEDSLNVIQAMGEIPKPPEQDAHKEVFIPEGESI